MGVQYHIFIDKLHLMDKPGQRAIAFITLGKNYIHYSLMDAGKTMIFFSRTLYHPEASIGQAAFDDLLSDNLLRNAAEVHLAIDTNKQTLIPVRLLSAENPAVYFRHIHEIEKDEVILNQSVNSDITELYVVKKPTLSYLKNEFRQLKIYSHSACLISTYMEMLPKLKHQYLFLIHNAHDTFFFTLFINGSLHFYQSFDLGSPSDVLYCLLNVLQWQQVEMTSLQLYLSGFSHAQQEIAALLGSYFHVNTFNDTMLDPGIPDAADIPPHILFNQYSLISCAL